ncbi:PHP domain-containing protein [Garciella nitratireducens]|uniref:PHP domain-containing protein n=1 Tax=Garciella nitratireducens TaxID=218205 RepID=UPI000DEB57E1|nr:PHP domain-containing protein [Garciella nitratireducens]RBP36841.1 hypothetical protein DFR81_1276 [Garciella nitratireducens]
MAFIDLHIHTTASDGIFTPKEIIHWAYKKNLKAIAITDHDTIDGLEEALEEGKKYNIEVIPGIEISTNYNNLEIHILGYYIDYEDLSLHKWLSQIRISRYIRAKKIIEKLNNLGFKITMDEIINIVGTGTIGRPHIAKALINHNYVKDKKEAFEKYLGKGKPAFVERYKITPIEAIKNILHHKGVPVLAHPGLINNNDFIFIIEYLINNGLQGLEVFHPKHNYDVEKKYYNIAKKYNLLITGGTDCHGDLINGKPILGNLNINEKYLKPLKLRKRINIGV